MDYSILSTKKFWFRKLTQNDLDRENESCLHIFMARYFSGHLQKNVNKSCDFRDLLLEGAIFIVGSQNLPHIIS